jgi:pimeloyl-ACP methyl ester carboxylesterase
MVRFFTLSALFAAFGALACSQANFSADEDDISPLSSPEVQCDTCFYPVVMVHGFLASGDTWTKFHQRFTSNGYKPGQLYAFDWNSLNQGANHVAVLDAFIDNVLTKTGAPKVRLIGHSAGGGLGYNYLSDAARAAKVDGYVHIGSSVQSGPAGPGGSVATLNLWSPDDNVAQGGDISGATNVSIPGQDHYQIATSQESFAAVWQFFHNQPPNTLEITPESIVCIAGRMLYFGENTPLVNGKVEIYPVNPATGERLTGSPAHTLFTDSLGYWPAINVDANVTYEFVATPPVPAQREIHYFREGFTHLNTLVYLRTIPPPTSLAGLLLGGLPNNDNQTVMNVFSASQAVINGRDTLTVAGSVLSTPQYAAPDKTAIAYFLYDDGDSQTELTPVGIFGTFPFLNGVDMFFPPNPPGAISLQFNNRQLNVRNLKSSQGIVVGVFD